MDVSPTQWAPDHLRQIGLGFERQAPQDILRWGVHTLEKGWRWRPALGRRAWC